MEKITAAARWCLCALLSGSLAGQNPLPTPRKSSPVIVGRSPIGARERSGGSCPPASGPSFVNKDLTNHNFRADPPGSLRYADFTRAKLRGAIFAGQDLTGASFANADLAPSSLATPVDLTNTTLNKTCFSGATLDAANFTFATITCADFTTTSLLEAVFGPLQMIQPGSGCRTKFNFSDIDVHAIATSNWGNVDFTDSIFHNLSADTFTLTGADVTGAKLGCTTQRTAGCKNFSGVDLTGANLTDVDLTNAVMVKATFDHAAMQGTTLLGVKAIDASFICAQFYGSTPSALCKTLPPSSTDPSHGASFQGAVLSNADFSQATLDYATFPGANLSGGVFRNASFQNASLESSNGLGVATIAGGDFTDAVFSNAHLNSVTFANAVLTGAVFSGKTTFNGTGFSGSIMPGANFNEAVLESVSFYGAILENATFTGTTMQTPPAGGSGVDFTCSQLGGANFTSAGVSAATFVGTVMPPASVCCSEKVGVPFCGTVAVTGLAYGPTIYPLLKSPLPCPNGDTAPCSGSQWVLSDWQTNACNNQRIYQTVWTPPTCGGPQGPIVKFNDLNLKQCILATLPGKPTEVPIATAQQFRTVACPNRGIVDLTGLEQFSALESLDLSANQITEFALPLNQLANLKIGYNQLTTLDVTNLSRSAPVRLDASNNKLTAIQGLTSINLNVLDVSYNQLASFDLPAQNNLVFADLSHNSLTNVLNQSSQDLSAMGALEYLDLSHNSLNTVGPAACLMTSPLPQGCTSAGQSPNLMEFFVECNPAFSCSSLNVAGAPGPLQTSGCLVHNPQTGDWLPLTNPSCSAGASRRRRLIEVPKP